jgi:hypothetical protein
MKRILVAALLVTTSLSVEASTLEKGAQFNCALFSAPVEGYVVACQVMKDVYSFYDKNLVIPASSRMVGNLVKDQIVWAVLSTPKGLQVSIPPFLFDTKRTQDKNVLLITALKDLQFE